MTDTFGQKLRDLRVLADVGLRELARLISKSPGYLSDVEHDNVPPPSEDVILKIAAALNADKKELLSIAKKMDPEISSYVAQEPEAADFLRMAKDKKFDSEDWEKLSQLAEIAKLGKSAKDKE
jgi:transcriptional regulator with XRE-family HTH domain